jgi:hypothetical protein
MGMNYPTLGSGQTSVILIPTHPQLVVRGVKVRKDAVEEVAVGQGAVVFCVDQGALRQIQIGD